MIPATCGTRLPASLRAAAIGLGLLALCLVAARAEVIRVEPGGDVPTIRQAAKIARDGDIVEVQAGEYHGDVAVWLQRRLTIRAVGGRAVVVADGKAAEDKALWVLRDGHFEIEGFDFIGARVPDGNGAGVRLERGSLVVRDTRFIDNEMGLLTGNDPHSELRIENCQFLGPVDGDHWYHNVYVGRIRRFVMLDSESHRARRGHLVKSRANVSTVIGNRLTDDGGTASYELEFPDGGEAQVEGNLIEQDVTTENLVMVSFGAEGYRWPRNRLLMNGNLLLNRAGAGAVFVRVAPGGEGAIDSNVWVGRGSLRVPATVAVRANERVAIRDR